MSQIEPSSPMVQAWAPKRMHKNDHIMLLELKQVPITICPRNQSLKIQSNNWKESISNNFNAFDPVQKTNSWNHTNGGNAGMLFFSSGLRAHSTKLINCMPDRPNESYL